MRNGKEPKVQQSTNGIWNEATPRGPLSLLVPDIMDLASSNN